MNRYGLLKQTSIWVTLEWCCLMLQRRFQAADAYEKARWLNLSRVVVVHIEVRDQEMTVQLLKWRWLRVRMVLGISEWDAWAEKGYKWFCIAQEANEIYSSEYTGHVVTCGSIHAVWLSVFELQSISCLDFVRPDDLSLRAFDRKIESQVTPATHKLCIKFKLSESSFSSVKLMPRLPDPNLSLAMDELCVTLVLSVPFRSWFIYISPAVIHIRIGEIVTSNLDLYSHTRPIWTDQFL